MAADTLFPFSCQGCGAFCCTNERLVLSPLELRSLVVAVGIDAIDLSAKGWLAAFPDAESGIPRVAVEFQPVKPDLTACPFLGIEAPVTPPVNTTSKGRLDVLLQHQIGARTALAAAGDDGGRSLSLRCQAYTGRPIMCRSFPLQFKLELGSDGQPTGWSALAHTRCPGHGLGSAKQTTGEYLEASGIAPLAAARLDWHRLNLAIAGAGITLRDHDTASGSRRALWDATLNLLFASYARPRLQVPGARYIPTLIELFQQHLAPVAGLMDAELRARTGMLTQKEAAGQLRTLVAACQKLEVDLDQPATEPVSLAWPTLVAFG